MGIGAKIRKAFLVAALVVTGSLYAQTSPDGDISSPAEDSLRKKNNALLIEAKAGERPALARGKDGAGLSAAPKAALTSTSQHKKVLRLASRPALKEGRAVTYRKKVQFPVVRLQGNKTFEIKHTWLPTGVNATIKTNPGRLPKQCPPTKIIAQNQNIEQNIEKVPTCRGSSIGSQTLQGSFLTAKSSSFSISNDIPPLMAVFKDQTVSYPQERQDLGSTDHAFGYPTGHGMLGQPKGIAFMSPPTILPQQQHRVIALILYQAGFSCKLQTKLQTEVTTWAIPGALCPILRHRLNEFCQRTV